MFTLSCESTTDITKRYLDERQIPVLAYSYTVDGEEFVDDMGEDGGLARLYNTIAQNKKLSTSQLSEEKYAEFFAELLKKGDLLHVAMGSGMSQSVDHAIAAAQKLQKQFPDRKIYVVDSTCSCVGYGMFVATLADMRDEGESIDAIYNWAMENRRNVQHQFFTTTLEYFRRSGRVSGPAYFIGNIFKLCPIMRLNYDGRIIAYSKVMSVSKALQKTVDEVSAHIQNGADYNGKLWISHANCMATAQILLKELKSHFPKADIRLFDIGPIIAVHCGPGTLAVYFWGDERIK